MSKSSKTLIVYFSFDDGANREVERLRRKIDADIIKLEPVKPYPSEYTKRLAMIEREFQQGKLPQIKTTLPNLQKYREIYLGYPPVLATACLQSSTVSFRPLILGAKRLFLSRRLWRSHCVQPCVK